MRSPARIALSMLIGCIVFVGLPFLTWGFTSIKDFTENRPRVAYLILMVPLQMGAALTMPGGGGSGAGTGKKPVKRQHLALLLLQIITVAIVLVGPYCDRRNIGVVGSADVFRYLGLGALAAGFCLMQWAVVCLGRQFSVEVTIQEDHRLVTDGIYRYLRHPRYLGLMLFFAGYSFVFRSGVSLLLAFALLPILFWRIKDEENLMHSQFGRDWETYVKRTWRLVPFVY